jgi:hypothetical protein
MVRSSINRRTVRVLQLNISAVSGIDKSSFLIGHFFSILRVKFDVGIPCIQTPVLVNVVNSEAIPICQPDIHCSEGVTVYNLSYFGKKGVQILMATQFLITHPIRCDSAVTGNVKFHDGSLLHFLVP